MEKQQITSVFFEGIQWTPRDGGTYQAVRVWANGRLLGSVGMGYGYGRQYETFGMELLANLGLVSPVWASRAPWLLTAHTGVVVYTSLAHDKKSGLPPSNVIPENVALFAPILEEGGVN